MRDRFLYTAGANLVRGAIGFATGVLLARWMGPEAYGNMAFLLGAYFGLRHLLDMGSSSAFFTFLSQKQRSRRFVLGYFAWLAFELVLIMTIVGLVLPPDWVKQVWQGQPRGLVLLAFGAAFLQNSVWPAVQRACESQRSTILAQKIGIVVVIVHLLAVSCFWRAGTLGLYSIFAAVLVEYTLAAAVGIANLKYAPDNSDRSAIPMYLRYCLPFVGYSTAAFIYEFADRWLLQRFGGGIEQAYYSVGAQFAAVALIGTTSILNIFWKEIAEAHHAGDYRRTELLYKKTSRVLFFFGAAIAGLLAPWSRELIGWFLGPAYIGGALTLALMFVYPVHQSLGQICGTMLLATEKAGVQFAIGMGFMLTSSILTYLILAPTDAAIPGFSMGSEGLAVKMIALQALQTNVVAWLIARIHGWVFDWSFQVIGIGLCLALGWVAKAAVLQLQLAPWAAMAGCCVIYSLMIIVSLWISPSLVGCSKEEILSWLGRGDIRLREGDL